MTTIFTQKNANYFDCINCDFKCSNKHDYNRHILTRKHQIRTNTTKNSKSTTNFVCECGKEYKHHSSLWNHRKKCNNSTKENVTEKKELELIIEIIKQNQELQKQNMIEKETYLSDKNLIFTLIQQNNELQKQMIELSKKVGNNNNNNNITNNKTKFNLNFFLNETCKDAMNLTDFVSSIKLQLTDLENVGVNGYVNGISNIIIKNLNALEVNKRPVHCSDLKREIMYVKDEDKWEKENNDKEKLQKAIKKVSYKNVLQISGWQKEHPGCEFSNNKKNDEYLQIVNESMGAFTDEENVENINKIIKNVAKEVAIEKEFTDV
jgi:hypothetical protein